MTDMRIAFELAGAILLLLWMFGLWLEWLDWQIPGPAEADEKERHANPGKVTV